MKRVKQLAAWFLMRVTTVMDDCRPLRAWGRLRDGHVGHSCRL